MRRPPAHRSIFVSVLALGAALACPAISPARSRHGADSMLEPRTVSLLVDYYEGYLRAGDVEAFQGRMMARYNEASLARLARSGGLQARRAAIFSLGLVGSFESNAVVARGLRDEDLTIRNLSQNALWAIWYRADTPEHNAVLQEVRDLIVRERFAEADALAIGLIARSPGFAEAHNQRAIALFFQGKMSESALECRRTLDRNPYHIGALAGLGQCYLSLDRHPDALAVFRRALTIQPFSADLRGTVEVLEAELD